MGDPSTRCRPKEMMRIRDFDLAEQGIGPTPFHLTSRSAKKLMAGKVSRDCLGKAMSTVARQHPPPAFREGLEQREPGPLDISKRRKMIGVSHGGFLKWGYPCSSSIYRWIFPYKPSSYWGTPIYGNPHMVDINHVLTSLLTT